MSIKKLPSVRRVVSVPQWERRCDGCDKVMPKRAEPDHLFIDGINMVEVGACCRERLVSTLREAGFKLRAYRKERAK